MVSSGIPLLSLFCGAGGLDLGFEEEGFRTVLALDNSSAAVESYNRNRAEGRQSAMLASLAEQPPEVIMEWWQERATEKEHPIGILGGPPCQAFSVANVHRRDDDPRSKLISDYLRILEAFHRKREVDFFVLENVVGLARKPHNNRMTSLLKRADSLGFDVECLTLDAVHFGVPQYRRRLFLVGLNRSRYSLKRFIRPKGSGHQVTVRQTIEGLPEPMFFSRGKHPEDLGLHPNHWCMVPRSPKFNDPAWHSGETKSRSFRKLAWDSPSWTVSYGHREVHVHPSGHRRLSVYEAMLIQGFPSSYQLSGTLSEQIQQISDAVPPPLARALAFSVSALVSTNDPECIPTEQPDRSGHSLQDGLMGLHKSAPRSTRL